MIETWPLLKDEEIKKRILCLHSLSVVVRIFGLWQSLIFLPPAKEWKEKEALSMLLRHPLKAASFRRRRRRLRGLFLSFPPSYELHLPVASVSSCARFAWCTRPFFDGRTDGRRTSSSFHDSQIHLFSPLLSFSLVPSLFLPPFSLFSPLDFLNNSHFHLHNKKGTFFP